MSSSNMIQSPEIGVGLYCEKNVSQTQSFKEENIRAKKNHKNM